MCRGNFCGLPDGKWFFHKVPQATVASQTAPERSRTERRAGPWSALLPAQSPELGVRHTRAGDCGEAWAAAPWAEKQLLVGTARRSAVWDGSVLPLGQRSTFESFFQKEGIFSLPTVHWTWEVGGNHFLISKNWPDSGLTRALRRETTGAWAMPHGPLCLLPGCVPLPTPAAPNPQPAVPGDPDSRSAALPLSLSGLLVV